MSAFLHWFVVIPLSRGHFYLKTMTELSLLSKMTSREIADLTGKQHTHIMRDIRIMESAWEKVAGSKFGLGNYLDENQQLRPEYHLSKRECLYIATKFNDEARAKLILRWERLETTKPDFSDPNVVLRLAQNWKDEQEKRLIAEKKAISEKVRADLNEHKACLANSIIREQEPKVVFADSVTGSENLILVREYAKVLS